MTQKHHFRVWQRHIGTHAASCPRRVDAAPNGSTPRPSAVREDLNGHAVGRHLLDPVRWCSPADALGRLCTQTQGSRSPIAVDLSPSARPRHPVAVPSRRRARACLTGPARRSAARLITAIVIHPSLLALRQKAMLRQYLMKDQSWPDAPWVPGFPAPSNPLEPGLGGQGALRRPAGRRQP